MREGTRMESLFESNTYLCKRTDKRCFCKFVWRNIEKQKRSIYPSATIKLDERMFLKKEIKENFRYVEEKEKRNKRYRRFTGMYGPGRHSEFR